MDNYKLLATTAAYVIEAKSKSFPLSLETGKETQFRIDSISVSSCIGLTACLTFMTSVILKLDFIHSSAQIQFTAFLWNEIKYAEFIKIPEQLRNYVKTCCIGCVWLAR